MTHIRRSLRNHLPFLVVMPLIIIALTWPTILRVFDRDGFWLVQSNSDANMLFWDAWYFERLITGRADFYYTDLLFHPGGVSLAFHNFSLPHMALMAALKTFMPPANAFNLTFLLLTFLNAAAGYMYLKYLFRDKWIALFGSVVFGASAFIISRPAHTNIAFVATIPLGLYFLHRGLAERRLRFMLAAGTVIGATAFIGMYTLVCLLIMLGFYLAYFAPRSLADRRFWLNVGLLSIVLAAFLFLRFYPMVADPQGLSDALGKNADKEVGKDLLSYFFNFHHPVTSLKLAELLPQLTTDDVWENVVFLGYVPLLLVICAFAKGCNRRRLLPWLALAVPFLVLRLGSHLTVNGITYADILLPKYYLTQALPFIFRPFWATDNFHAGTLLPFAVLCCFGLLVVTRTLPTRYSVPVTLLLAGMVAFEYYQLPRRFDLAEGRLAFIDWLQQEEDQESIRIINLPTGATNSKFYGFYQTFNGYPHAEGRPTRTPPRAFDYMESNLLLRNWRAGRVYNCLPGNMSEFISAQAQLRDDGFTHVVLHFDRLYSKRIAPNFVNIPAAYSDEFVGIFRIEDLDESCNISDFLSRSALQHLYDVNSAAVVPWQTASLLILDPIEAAESRSDASSPAVLYNLRGFSLLHDQVLHEPARADDSQSVHPSALEASEVILLIYNPRVTESVRVDEFRKWIAASFVSCGRFATSDDTALEYFLRPSYPCQLVHSDTPFAVDYDNGIQLGNLLASVEGDTLELYLIWKRLPASAHAFSIQFFDEAGARAHNQDFVFHRDALGRYEIDLSTLEAGEYSAKLIVYNYDTGVSVPGLVLSSGTRFERELEFMTHTVE